MAFPLPPPPHRPGFSDKEIFLVEASLVFELPHMTFPSELYLVRGKRCFSGLVLLLLTVHLDFFVCFLVFMQTSYCFLFSPNTTPFGKR